ncbi:MAG: PadR family transcriptional regulator [Bacteroidetes bacterium]|nr:PadR family transcriptional regulator [Bacteroidota bacterium]
MNHLTRSEEYILLAVWKLQEEAYTLPIQARLEEITGRDWSLSSVYAPLERLVSQNLINSDLTDPLPERGGRPKRIYRLTNGGRKALLEIQAVGQSMWSGVTAAALERGH